MSDRINAETVRSEMGPLLQMVDEFAIAMKARLRYQVEYEYGSWRDGYPTREIKNEILQMSADIRHNRSEKGTQRKLTDLAINSMALWERSRRVQAHTNEVRR